MSLMISFRIKLMSLEIELHKQQPPVETKFSPQKYYLKILTTLKLKQDPDSFQSIADPKSNPLKVP
jgi:hypothetical protein